MRQHPLRSARSTDIGYCSGAVMLAEVHAIGTELDL